MKTWDVTDVILFFQGFAEVKAYIAAQGKLLYLSFNWHCFLLYVNTSAGVLSLSVSVSLSFFVSLSLSVSLSVNTSAGVLSLCFSVSLCLCLSLCQHISWCIISLCLCLSLSLTLCLCLSVSLCSVRVSSKKLLKIPKHSLKCFDDRSLSFIIPSGITACQSVESPHCLNSKPSSRLPCLAGIFTNLGRCY